MRPSVYAIYRQLALVLVPVYCIKHEDFSCYMCFISRRPLTYCVIKVIQYRKELYDFYYTLVTLTTVYK